MQKQYYAIQNNRKFHQELQKAYLWRSERYCKEWTPQNNFHIEE